MKVFLLKTNIDRNLCLEKASEIINEVSYNQQHNTANVSSGQEKSP